MLKGKKFDAFALFDSLEHKFQSLEHKFDSLEHNFIAWSETILTHLITNINRKEQKHG